MTTRLASLGAALALVTVAAAASGQTPVTARSPGDRSSGEPRGSLPILPETVVRDASGHVTVRAVRLAAPLRLDGKLDEDVYHAITPTSNFIEADPREGAPATERTEVWVLYDNEYIYVGARMFESQPERMVVSDMRKDSPYIFSGNETFSFLIDTYHDLRNGFGFILTPIGGRMDGQITNEKWNRDWNTVWDFGVSRFEGGWTAEVAIPFKSLRYGPGASQTWGFNARRINKWKNEISHLTAIPRAAGGNGLYRSSLAATLVGLEVPSGSKNVEVKPYGISTVSTDRTASVPTLNDLAADAGLDVKYGITQNLTADFTYNTDFAQVEADEQQINLTRFSTFFPEKREFFLENPGLFTFGGIGTGNAGTPQGDAPLLFHSRRIGLNQGRVVPIVTGGRLTGRVGRLGLGLINIQTGEERLSASPSTNFSVMRLKRDVLRKSSVGLIATARSIASTGAGANGAFGVDGAFSFFDNLDISTYWARSESTGRAGDETSYRADLAYNGDRYGLELEQLSIGDQFSPDVGFLRRADVRRSYAMARYSPRPRSVKGVRRFVFIGSLAYVETGAGRLDTRDAEGSFAIELDNSDKFTSTYRRLYEFVPGPFAIAPAVVVPVGAYPTDGVNVMYALGQQRAISGTASVDYGTFYSGHRTTIGLASGRVRVTAQFSVEPTYSINKVDLLEGSFTAHLAGSRVVYSVTPLMFVSALVQYNSTTHNASANVRLRWEYRPGSELFVVYNEERDTAALAFPQLATRSFIVKINRLLRF